MISWRLEVIRLGDLRGGGSRASLRILITPLQCPCWRLIATARHTTFTRRALRLSRVCAAANESSRLLRSLLLTHAHNLRDNAQSTAWPYPLCSMPITLSWTKLFSKYWTKQFSWFVSTLSYHTTGCNRTPMLSYSWYTQSSMFCSVKRKFP